MAGLTLKNTVFPLSVFIDSSFMEAQMVCALVEIKATIISVSKFFTLWMEIKFYNNLNDFLNYIYKCVIKM